MGTGSAAVSQYHTRSKSFLRTFSVAYFGVLLYFTTISFILFPVQMSYVANFWQHLSPLLQQISRFFYLLKPSYFFLRLQVEVFFFQFPPSGFRKIPNCLSFQLSVSTDKLHAMVLRYTLSDHHFTIVGFLMFCLPSRNAFSTLSSKNSSLAENSRKIAVKVVSWIFNMMN